LTAEGWPGLSYVQAGPSIPDYEREKKRGLEIAGMEWGGKSLTKAPVELVQTVPVELTFPKKPNNCFHVIPPRSAKGGFQDDLLKAFLEDCDKHAHQTSLDPHFAQMFAHHAP